MMALVHQRKTPSSQLVAQVAGPDCCISVPCLHTYRAYWSRARHGSLTKGDRACCFGGCSSDQQRQLAGAACAGAPCPRREVCKGGLHALLGCRSCLMKGAKRDAAVPRIAWDVMWLPACRKRAPSIRMMLAGKS